MAMNLALPENAVASFAADGHRLFDVSTKLWIGGRDVQQDALYAAFPQGEDTGFLVLADGMGGHASGEIAAEITIDEVRAEIEDKFDSFTAFERFVPEFLKVAAQRANDAVGDSIRADNSQIGMGSTLVAPVFLARKLYWVSVGDSPLYLIRNGEIRQLNEDHSMAADIDFMVAHGMISAERGANHPDRNCLKSAITGHPLKKVDAPKTPVEVEEDDIFVLSSDGLQTLTDGEILEIVLDHSAEDAGSIAAGLIDMVRSFRDPDQDNTSVAVIKYRGG